MVAWVLGNILNILKCNITSMMDCKLLKNVVKTFFQTLQAPFTFQHRNFPRNLKNRPKGKTHASLNQRDSTLTRGQSCPAAGAGLMPTVQSLTTESRHISVNPPSIALLAPDQTHLGHFDVNTVKSIPLPCFADRRRDQYFGRVRRLFSLNAADTTNNFDCTCQWRQPNLGLSCLHNRQEGLSMKCCHMLNHTIVLCQNKNPKTSLLLCSSSITSSLVLNN